MDAFSIYQTTFMTFMVIWLAPIAIGISLYKKYRLNYMGSKLERLFIPFKGIGVLVSIICDTLRIEQDLDDSYDKDYIPKEDLRSVLSKDINDKNFFSQALKNNYPMIHLDDYNELISEYEDIAYDKTIYNINRNKNSPELIAAIESYIKYRFGDGGTDHMASPYSFFLESKLVLYLIKHEMNRVLYEAFIEEIEILIHSYAPGYPYNFKHNWKELLGIWINDNKQIVLVISYNKDGDLEVYSARHRVLLTK